MVQDVANRHSPSNDARTWTMAVTADRSRLASTRPVSSADCPCADFMSSLRMAWYLWMQIAGFGNIYAAGFRAQDRTALCRLA